MTIARVRERKLQNTISYIERCRQDPVWWANQTMQHRALPGEPTITEDPNRSWELDDFQVDLLNAVCDVWRKAKPVINLERKPQISVVSGHGPGKTHTAALIVHYFNSCWPGRCVVTAPKYDQVKTRMFAAIQKIDMRAEPWYRKTHEIGETQAYWYTKTGERNRNYCVLGETAKNPENLAGHHERYQLVVVEEATGVPEVLYPVIFGALSTGVLQILLMISNGTKRTGTFADSHLKAREAANYFRYRIRYENSRRVSRKWAQRLIDKYGANSPVVKVRVLGEFAEDEPNQLISMQWIVNARNGDAKPDGSIPRRKISIDVAAGGVCMNVLTCCFHFQSKVVARKQKSCSYPMHEVGPKVADDAVKMWRDYEFNANNGDFFVVDVIGPGLTVAGELIRRGYPVVFHQGGASSTDPARYRNQRTQAYLSCRNAFRDGQLILAEDLFDDPQEWEDLEAQLLAIMTKDNNDRVEDLETKKELVERLGFSPDNSDSLSMQWSSIAPTIVTGTQHDASIDAPVVISSRILEGMHRAD